MWSNLKVIIIVQFFYAFAITILAYALSSAGIGAPQIDPFQDLSNRIDFSNTTKEVQNSLDSQLNIPVVDIGSLVFFSGNILLDLLLNFAFAVPQILTLLVHGFMLIFNVEGYMWTTFQLFISGLIGLLYLIGILQTLINVRSQSKIL